MIVTSLTRLESEVLARFRREHQYLSAAISLVVIGRDNTGVGRFTYMRATVSGQPLVEPGKPRNVHTLKTPILMEGIRSPGLGAVLFVEAAEITLELHTYVGSWDGEERLWKFGDA